MTRETQPLVSILVPAFNTEATLAQTLQSALASSYPNLELVLVDDGSTDATTAIAQAIAREEKRVRVFRQRHRGVSAALNFGLAQCRGEFVARLDADDLWHPSKLAKQVKLLAANPSVALACTDVRYVDAGGCLVRDAAPQTMAGKALCQCLYYGIVGGGSSALMRRSTLETVGGYDEDLDVWEDLLLHLKVARLGEIAFIPEYLTGYRLRRDSSSANLERSLTSWRLAKRRIETEIPGIPGYVHRWSHARRLLELAEGFAWERRCGTGAKLLAESLVSDPTRTTEFLAYRLRRRLSANRRSPQGEFLPFAEADVTRTFALSNFDARLEGKRLHALDRSRDLLLQAIDRALTPVPQPTGGEERSPLAAFVP